jgi:2,4-dienoyl-CoA reductase-like NADH-dependent reductase (Old Yellow Enzyme family)
MVHGMSTSLFSPLVFPGGVRARNGTVLAAMTNGQSNADGTLNHNELHWLSVRAQGGFGVITTCASHVAKDGQGWAGQLGCFDDAHIPGLTRLAQDMHDRGALALVQIFHGGVRANPELTGELPWSASAAADGSCRAATAQDLERVTQQFAQAARRCHAAGMDGVEIHGAHGYLLTQFLSTTDNTRTDHWGGTLENRARLVRQVVRAVRAAAPTPFVVGVRLSPENFGNATGMDLDESLAVAAWLCQDGADFIHASLWDVRQNSQKRPHQHVLQAFRSALPAGIPLLTAGKIWTRPDAEHALAMGASAVALGRCAIANPDWPLRIADPTWAPRVPPLTAQELAQRGLSKPFIQYMRRWKDFVLEPATEPTS